VAGAGDARAAENKAFGLHRQPENKRSSPTPAVRMMTSSKKD
jgi:hypothetical protein